MLYKIINIVNNSINVADFPDGAKATTPPVILAALPIDPKKKTLCVYGHLDVPTCIDRRLRIR